MKLQDYTPKELIDGVEIFNPTVHRDDGGEFREVARFEGESYDSNGLIHGLGGILAGEIQVNHSVLEPNVVKAFHVHKDQTDMWYVLGKAIVVLFDMRNLLDKSYTTVMLHSCHLNRLVLENQKILIPPGVAHGISNPYKDRLHMIYFTNRYFNPKDEFRVPWNIFGKDLWEIQNG